MRKRRWKAGLERRRRQRLHTREARGREDGSGGRRRRISERRTSSSIGGRTTELGPRRGRLSVMALSQLVRDVKLRGASQSLRFVFSFPEGRAHEATTIKHLNQQIEEPQKLFRLRTSSSVQRQLPRVPRMHGHGRNPTYQVLDTSGYPKIRIGRFSIFKKRNLILIW
jgi:hypothetical protein